MMREKSGYVLNSLLAPLMKAAAELLVGGYADVETVDSTWRTATGSPYGPFQIYDIIGLRQAYNIANASADAASHAWASYLLDNYLQRGKTGVEVGEGFYKYA
jgi:3-hydroxyacyl-CoA dehydrogenase